MRKKNVSYKYYTNMYLIFVRFLVKLAQKTLHKVGAKEVQAP